MGRVWGVGRGLGWSWYLAAARSRGQAAEDVVRDGARHAVAEEIGVAFVVEGAATTGTAAGQWLFGLAANWDFFGFCSAVKGAATTAFFGVGINVDVAFTLRTAVDSLFDDDGFSRRWRW